jgi:maltose O-acetyltransferase
MMTEVEKLDAGLPYDMTDPGVNGRKLHAVEMTNALEAVPVTDHERRVQAIKNLFGGVGENPEVLPGFRCDNGSNIHVGDDFLANYNVTILDIAPVYIGSHVLIGPNTLISTVNHPLTPAGRRKHLGIAKPVHIGDDVWIGGNVTIVPGVTIGNNVIIAAGAVVTKDVPDNVLVGGVPAKVLRELENDL